MRVESWWMYRMSGVPTLCECDDFGSICQTCKIALDKITNSRSNLPPAPLPSSGDETMTQNLLSSSNFLCSECGKGFEKNWMPKRKDIYQFECKKCNRKFRSMEKLNNYVSRMHACIKTNNIGFMMEDIYIFYEFSISMNEIITSCCYMLIF